MIKANINNHFSLNILNYFSLLILDNNQISKNNKLIHSAKITNQLKYMHNVIKRKLYN